MCSLGATCRALRAGVLENEAAWRSVAAARWGRRHDAAALQHAWGYLATPGAADGAAGELRSDHLSDLRDDVGGLTALPWVTQWRAAQAAAASLLGATGGCRGVRVASNDAASGAGPERVEAAAPAAAVAAGAAGGGDSGDGASMFDDAHLDASCGLVGRGGAAPAATATRWVDDAAAAHCPGSPAPYKALCRVLRAIGDAASFWRLQLAPHGELVHVDVTDGILHGWVLRPRLGHAAGDGPETGGFSFERLFCTRLCGASSAIDSRGVKLAEVCGILAASSHGDAAADEDDGHGGAAGASSGVGGAGGAVGEVGAGGGTDGASEGVGATEGAGASASGAVPEGDARAGRADVAPHVGGVEDGRGAAAHTTNVSVSVEGTDRVPRAPDVATLVQGALDAAEPRSCVAGSAPLYLRAAGDDELVISGTGGEIRLYRLRFQPVLRVLAAFADFQAIRLDASLTADAATVLSPTHISGDTAAFRRLSSAEGIAQAMADLDEQVIEPRAPTVTLVKALAARQGVYIAKYGPHGPEVLQLSVALPGDSNELIDGPVRSAMSKETFRLEATKVVGDPNVPGGHLSWAVDASLHRLLPSRDITERHAISLNSDAIEVVTIDPAMHFVLVAGEGHINRVPGMWNPEREAGTCYLAHDGTVRFCWEREGSHLAFLLDFVPGVFDL